MARIRTVKPEFWQNEQLASISMHARLLAIALLNFSDDDGFFLSNPALVRAACFPFEEDSKNVLRSIQELSEIGYIEIRDCSGKGVGRVCKFRDHQRIDKPQNSKLVALFEKGKPQKAQQNIKEERDSENIPGTIQDYSAIDQRLEQGKEQGKESNIMSGFSNQTFLPSNEEPDVPFEAEPAKPNREYSDEFEQFWAAFPKTRRTKKGDAYRKWKIAIRSAEPAFLIKRAREYCHSEKGRSEFAVMPSVWLNGACWNDDDAAWNPSKVLAQQRSASRLPTAEDKANYNSGAY